MSEATPDHRGSEHDRGQVKTPVNVGAELSAWPGYPAAVRGGGFVFVSGVRGGRPGFAATRYADLPDEIAQRAQGYTMVDELEGTVAADAWTAHDNMARILTAAGTRDDQILRQRMWQRDKRYFPVYERVRQHWQPEAAPSSGLGVSSIGGRFGRWIGIESFAVDVEDPGPHGGSRDPDTAGRQASPISVDLFASGIERATCIHGGDHCGQDW